MYEPRTNYAKDWVERSRLPLCLISPTTDADIFRLLPKSGLTGMKLNEIISIGKEFYDCVTTSDIIDGLKTPMRIVIIPIMVVLNPFMTKELNELASKLGCKIRFDFLESEKLIEINLLQ
jgi:hypothetical protein